jgi:hypothetical protein
LKPHSDGLIHSMEFYCALMQEIKIRDQGISELSAANTPAQIAYESAYLQLRMICELIALACLIIHGDIPATTRKMKETWEADKILKRLTEIHPNFYPHPVNAAPGDKFTIQNITSECLSKSELISLYGKCGHNIAPDRSLCLSERNGRGLAFRHGHDGSCQIFAAFASAFCHYDHSKIVTIYDVRLLARFWRLSSVLFRPP